MNERRTDFELLRAYVRHGEQLAFADLVRRHLDLVYATALRKVQDEGAAEEVAQNVFGILVRKAWQFAPDDSLPAWLYCAALLESKEWLRGELRRRRREQTAAELGTTMKTPDEQSALRVLVPLLDEALLSLREKERTALLLRYYENQSLRNLGAALGVGEDAAQKRVATALESLTDFFRRRGFKTATAVAAAAALEHTAASAPAVVCHSVVAAAAQMSPPALMGLTALAARFGSFTKLQTAALCLALAAVPLGWQYNKYRRAREQVSRWQTQAAVVQTEYSTVQSELERTEETSSRLRASLAAATDSAARSAEEARSFEAWKKRLCTVLLADDYRWPNDSAFVRIPKSALRHLEVRLPILPPGVLKQEARELLGLTPQERAQLEDALHSHFAALDSIIEAQLYETNQPARLRVPDQQLAAKVWALPALGDEVKTHADELQAGLQGVLGADRWPLIQSVWESSGSGTLRQVLNLDAGRQSQEIGVWLQRNELGQIVVGSGWAGGCCSSSVGGVNLSLFDPRGKAFAVIAKQEPRRIS